MIATGGNMKKYLVMFALVGFSFGALAVESDAQLSSEQRIEMLEHEVAYLREVIAAQQPPRDVKPQCLMTGERCTEASDVCCQTGTFCAPRSICP